MQAAQASKLKARCSEQAFISRGFQNWKDATRLFCRHEISACHSEAVEKIITKRQVGELLSTKVSEDRKRRASLLQILRALRYLARQGLSIRGSSLTNEIEGNCSQLLKVFCTFDSDLPLWLNKYMSADTQNELLRVMATEFFGRLHQGFAGDHLQLWRMKPLTAAHMQCVIVLRWVDDDLEPHKDFIGLHSTPSEKSSFYDHSSCS